MSTTTIPYTCNQPAYDPAKGHDWEKVVERAGEWHIQCSQDGYVYLSAPFKSEGMAIMHLRNVL